MGNVRGAQTLPKEESNQSGKVNRKQLRQTTGKELNERVHCKTIRQYHRNIPEAGVILRVKRGNITTILCEDRRNMNIDYSRLNVIEHKMKQSYDSDPTDPTLTLSLKLILDFTVRSTAMTSTAFMLTAE